MLHVVVYFNTLFRLMFSPTNVLVQKCCGIEKKQVELFFGKLSQYFPPPPPPPPPPKKKKTLGFAFTVSNFDVHFQYFVLIYIEIHPIGI